MTYEELEKLKKEYDYCIIPIKNIIGIDEDMPILGYGIKIIKIKPDVDNGNFMQFVNSGYFRTWGKGDYPEENNKPPIEPDLLYKPSNITVEELRDGAMKEIEAIWDKINKKIEEVERLWGIKND